jgi:hypothetical protein
MVLVSDYAVHGLALTDIPKAQKGPIEVGWNLKENAITCPEVAALLTGNVGLLHAYCSPAPTMALDIDIYAQAEGWLAERGVDLEELMEAEDAVQINSGKKGSAKLLFRLTEGMAPIRTAQIKAPNDDRMFYLHQYTPTRVSLTNGAVRAHTKKCQPSPTHC